MAADGNSRVQGWPVSRSYGLLALTTFLLAGASMLVDWLGTPMIFAFTTLCSVFLVFGAVQWKRERLDQQK